MKNKKPQLGHAVELFLSTVGITGGFKICWFTLSGQVSEAIDLARQHNPNSIKLSEEDFLEFSAGKTVPAFTRLDVLE